MMQFWRNSVRQTVPNFSLFKSAHQRSVSSGLAGPLAWLPSNSGFGMGAQVLIFCPSHRVEGASSLATAVLVCGGSASIDTCYPLRITRDYTLFYTSDYFWLLSFSLGGWEQLDKGLASVVNEDQPLCCDPVIDYSVMRVLVKQEAPHSWCT